LLATWPIALGISFSRSGWLNKGGESRSCLQKPLGGAVRADVVGKRRQARSGQDDDVQRGRGVFARRGQQAANLPLAGVGGIKVGADLDQSDLSFLEG
jgi:hypothetical protein